MHSELRSYGKTAYQISLGEIPKVITFNFGMDGAKHGAHSGKVIGILVFKEISICKILKKVHYKKDKDKA